MATIIQTETLIVTCADQAELDDVLSKMNANDNYGYTHQQDGLELTLTRTVDHGDKDI